MSNFATASLAARAASMADLWKIYDAHYDEIIGAAVAAIEATPELSSVVAELRGGQDAAQGAERQKEIRRMLEEAMVRGAWEPYLEDMRRSGAEYARAGIDFSVWTVIITGFRSSIIGFLGQAYGSEPSRFAAVADALGAYLDAALSTIGDEYLRSREEIIKHQLVEIRELSTPVLRVREGLLILPLIGIIDTDRARRFTASLLETIRKDRARVVIIDLTGVPAVDSAVANHLLMAAKAARLLGAAAIITGISTANAETLARLGVDLGEVQTLSDLQTGIQEADLKLAEHGGAG
jgi:rsbT co-antagonist protein RsbR